MQKVLFIGMVWPEPNATAAGVRMLQLIKTFLDNKYQVIFASTAATSTLSYNLELLNVTQISIALNHSSFDHYLKELQPDIVVYDRFITEEQFGWRVAAHAPKALRVLDTEDLHSLRVVRSEAFKNKRTFSITDWLQSDITKREVASIYRSDLSLIISKFEMQLLVDTLRIEEQLLLFLPFMVESIVNEVFAKYPQFEERKDFICIGNGKHSPNVAAVQWLKNAIWPQIRKQLPESKLTIYGAYLPQHITAMHLPKEGFYVHGYVANLEQVFTAARINLAPLVFGAGLKGKLVDAMRFGTPSITTPIGAEGMHDSLPWNGAIAANENDFAQAAVSYYSDKNSWCQAQQDGLQILKELYDASFLSIQLMARIEALQAHKEEHRNANFIGALLGHQSMQSTKYMSKWIEAKNASKN